MKIREFEAFVSDMCDLIGDGKYYAVTDYNRDKNAYFANIRLQPEGELIEAVRYCNYETREDVAMRVALILRSYNRENTLTADRSNSDNFSR